MGSSLLSSQINFESFAMPIRRTANAETAIQYLTWALEEIEKIGNREAAHKARIALQALREGDKTDEQVARHIDRQVLSGS
jgi:hypothetical protein